MRAALSEHKAVLFDKDRNLFVIPVTVAKLSGYTEPWARGEQVWQGAYVFTVSPEAGVVFRGGVTHFGNGEVPSYENNDRWVFRSLYIENVLYSLSPSMVKMNSLVDLAEINSVSL